MAAPSDEKKRPGPEEPRGVKCATVSRVQANDAVAPQTFVGTVSGEVR